MIDTEGRDTAGSRAALIARLNSARMFNPGLRVLFVLVGVAGTPSDEERAAVRGYVARVMSATLASTIIRGAAPANMDALYREVFNH
ncbi:hypothetical protein [Duganella sp. BuS-21]|uniref:hypothetical protein n=1 Tax=Duganella sp. BuS-21 TaxID=2943848 RepID=UPI0035A67CC8